MSEVLATFSYALINDGKEYDVVCTNKETATLAIIPRLYNGKPVTTVRSEGFRGCPNLKRVEMSYILRIGQSGFYQCTALTDVEIASVVKIEDYAFFSTALKSIIIPPMTTKIGVGAFLNCSTLNEIILSPMNPPALGANAFYLIDFLAKFLILNICLDTYKNEPSWSVYAGKMVPGDLSIYFVLNANATRRYINEAALQRNDGVTEYDQAYVKLQNGDLGFIDIGETENGLIRRNNNANVETGIPTQGNEAANKTYVDNLVDGKLDKSPGNNVRRAYVVEPNGDQTTKSVLVTPTEAGTIPYTSDSGRIKSGVDIIGESQPMQNNDLTRKDYVDSGLDNRILLSTMKESFFNNLY